MNENLVGEIIVLEDDNLQHTLIENFAKRDSTLKDIDIDFHINCESFTNYLQSSAKDMGNKVYVLDVNVPQNSTSAPSPEGGPSMLQELIKKYGREILNQVIFFTNHLNFESPEEGVTVVDKKHDILMKKIKGKLTLCLETDDSRRATAA